MTNNEKFIYSPKYKIKDKVISLRDKKIGIIKRIDNLCSKLYDQDYENPGYLEYYIKWHNAWTRHYCFELDTGEADGIMILTPAAEIIYGKT